MATTTKKQFKLDATRPFYAAVGAGDLAIALARNGVADVQDRVAKIDVEPKAPSTLARNLDSSVVVTRGADTPHSVVLSAFNGSIHILGASSMLADIERQLEHFVTGRYSAAYRHPMA